MSSSDSVTFREMLRSERFYYGVEVVSTRGLPLPDSPTDLAAFANALLGDRRVGWISITDNPGGGPMLPPDWLAGIVAEAKAIGAAAGTKPEKGTGPLDKGPVPLGGDDRRARIVLHMSCKDLNRNALEAAAWRYAAEGFENILAITGDYPTGGFGGRAEGVFDLDSLGLITMLRSMNEGLQVPGRSGKMETLPKTNFFIGCAVSPFKRYERELLPQYFKLVRKIACGARWVIPQLGYDMRKFNEVKMFLELRGIEVPIVGNVYLLSRAAARMFHCGKLAGCVVTDTLLEDAEKYAAGPDKGKKFFLELAAKQLAVFKGLGFAAGYLGGMAKAETFGQIIDTAESYARDDWREFVKEIQYSQPGEFFLFEHDSRTGLCESRSINPEYLESLQHAKKSKEVTLGYRLSRLVHDVAFTRDKALYPLLKKVFARFDKKPGFLSRMAYSLEKASKSLMYGCRDCGDCSLPECAFICPKRWCSKCGRNGPCGGSSGGRCELDDKECLWARIYERLKYYGETEQMLDRPVTLYNAALQNTSSWANLFLERDHSAPGSPEDQTNKK